MFYQATIFYEHFKNQFNVSMSIDKRGMEFLDRKKYDVEIFNVNPAYQKIFFYYLFNFFLTIYA